MKREQVIAKLQAKVKHAVAKKRAQADMYVGAGLVSARGAIFDQAVDQGLTRIYVHGREAQTLHIVNEAETEN